MLTDLPNEVLLLIANCLPETRDMLHFASCSRGLQDLLLLAAYSCVTVNLGCISSLSRLTTVLSRKPTRAARVRHLHIDRPSVYPCQHECKARHNPRDINSILSKLEYTGEEKAEWNDALIGDGDAKWDQEDAWWAMLWTLLPNLEELDVTWQYGTDYRKRILERVGALNDRLNVGPTFMQLRKVNLRVWDTEAGIDSTEALLFFRLPVLKTFSGFRIIEHVGDGSDTDEQELQGFSTVTDIQLHSSNSNTGFTGLTRACASLKSIIYHHTITSDSDQLWVPSAFYKSVCRHKSTLESISMNGELGFDLGTGDLFFGSLLHFAALKSLCIPAMCIINWTEHGNRPLNHLLDVLPPNLERLAVENFHSCVDKVVFAEQLEDVLKAPGRYQNLHRLSLVGHFYDETKSRADINSKDPRLDPQIMRLAARLALTCMTRNPFHFGILDLKYGWVAPKHICPCCLAGHGGNPDELIDSEDDEHEFDDDEASDDEDGDDEPTSESDNETSDRRLCEISPREDD